MRKIYLTGVLLSSGLAFAQPVGTPPATNTNAQSSAAWYRGGNTATTPNNIFGTAAGFNSPIYIQTNGLNRGAFFATQIAGVSPNWVNQLPSGGGMSINFNPAAPIRNPLSLLHIGEGPSTVDDVQGGYRAWMQVGTYYGHQTDNYDV